MILDANSNPPVSRVKLLKQKPRIESSSKQTNIGIISQSIKW